MQQAVAVQDMNKPNLLNKLRAWNTHVDDYGNGWQNGIIYYTRSSACEWPALVESFICCWVGLSDSHGHVKLVIGGFECRYDTNSVAKGFMNNNLAKLFVRTEFS